VVLAVFVVDVPVPDVVVGGTSELVDCELEGDTVNDKMLVELEDDKTELDEEEEEEEDNDEDDDCETAFFV